MSTPTTNFLGIPVQGSIIQSHRPSTPQKPIGDLQALLMPVLLHKDVEAIRWTQYTPYFNDGDACYFSVNDVFVKFKGIDDIGEQEDGYVSSADVEINQWQPTVDPRLAAILGTVTEVTPGGWDQTTTRQYVPAVTTHDGQGDKALYDAIVALEVGFGNCFEEVLLEAFGDHASVTVYKSKIEVDEYSHD